MVRYTKKLQKLLSRFIDQCGGIYKYKQLLEDDKYQYHLEYILNDFYKRTLGMPKIINVQTKEVQYLNNRDVNSNFDFRLRVFLRELFEYNFSTKYCNEHMKVDNNGLNILYKKAMSYIYKLIISSPQQFLIKLSTFNKLHYPKDTNTQYPIYTSYFASFEYSNQENELLLPQKSLEQTQLQREMIAELKKEKLLHKWGYRKNYFSKFDAGIKMDIESWFSVTPEKLAIHQAERCKKTDLVVDPFCGCGGNVVHLAKRSAFVIAGDIDPHKIDLSINNSEVYGVRNNIDYVIADACYLMRCIPGDSLFLSPPWGGPSYKNKKYFSLETDMTPNIYSLFDSMNDSYNSAILFLPRTSILSPLDILSNKYFSGTYEAEEDFVGKVLKAITVYLGNATKR